MSRAITMNDLEPMDIIHAKLFRTFEQFKSSLGGRLKKFRSLPAHGLDNACAIICYLLNEYGAEIVVGGYVDEVPTGADVYWMGTESFLPSFSATEDGSSVVLKLQFSLTLRQALTKVSEEFIHAYGGIIEARPHGFQNEVHPEYLWLRIPDPEELVPSGGTTMRKPDFTGKSTPQASNTEWHGEEG